ncbi:MAG: hypothetical protein K2V38_04655, partial [Gemmataceae bacterium]|nr:hypothetical protein [Gemmataceae bacterium]
MRGAAFFACVLLSFPAAARAAEPVDNEFFEKKVRPILVANCLSCHDAKKQKGGLRLDAKAGFTKGGDNGAVVKPGDAKTSLLVEVVGYAGDI